MLSDARPHKWWELTRPCPDGLTGFTEPLSAAMIWSDLRSVEEAVPDALSRFQGTKAEQRNRARLAANFIRQAHANSDAADRMSGSAASLLNYYTALNLAKAYLAVVEPALVESGAKIRHGLSFKPSKSQGLRGDTLVVDNGLFAHLYRHRTGLQLPKGTELPIARVLQNIPEIGMELHHAGLGPTKVRSVFHSIAGTESQVWAVLAIPSASTLLTNAKHPEYARVLKSFQQVKAPSRWRELFAISPRARLRNIAFFESRIPIDVGSEAEAVGRMRSLQVPQQTWSALSPYLDWSHEPFHDGLLSASLYASREFPMPPSLARYAAMFYLSSLVRYRPDRLDPRANGREAWVFDTLADFSPIQILATSRDWISGEHAEWEVGQTVRD